MSEQFWPVWPAQSPLQLEKKYPDAGVAVSVTAVPELYAQPAPQLGEIEPEPVTAVVSVYCFTKVAVTDCAAVMPTEHVGVVPLHAPLQPMNVDPDAAVAINETVVAGVTPA